MRLSNRNALSVLIVTLTASISVASASDYDFTNYKPTLNSLYDAENSTIKSGYGFKFNTADSGTSQFTYYIYDATNQTITPSYYTHSLTLSSDPASPVRNSKLTNSSKDVSLFTSFYNTGYDKGIVNNGDSGDADDVMNRRGEITTIYGDFFANMADVAGGGGAAITNDGVIGVINGDFVRNYARNNGYEIFGGAILNGTSTSNANVSIDTINGNFIRNYLYDRSGASASGGAISNRRYINKINGDFIGNYAQSTGYGNPLGGAIMNASGLIGTIKGDFISNRAYNNSNSWSTAAGGGINNFATINDVLGNFNGNYVIGGQSFGGGIFNQGKIGNVIGNYIGNYAIDGSGGAIASGDILQPIRFVVDVAAWNNANEIYAPDFYESTSGPAGTGIKAPTKMEIDLVQGKFYYNYATGLFAEGGAIYNEGLISTIKNSEFTKNYVTGSRSGSSATQRGGAIANVGDDGIITLIENTSFYNNSAINTNATGTALGGAIYTQSNLHFLADATNNFHMGNTRSNFGNTVYNSIYVSTDGLTPAKLTFEMKNNGNFIFHDNIDGGSDALDRSTQYNIDIKGDGTSTFYMNNDIVNAGNVTVTNAILYFNESSTTGGKGAFEADTNNLSKAPVTNLTLDNAEFNLHNRYLETVRVNNYTANNSILHIDVNHNGTKWVADVLNISGALTGTTKVVVQDPSGVNNQIASVIFAVAPNEHTNTTAFSVYRVYGSPYMWEARLNYENQNLATDGSTWYLVSTTTPNNETNINPNPIPIPKPGPEPVPEVEPEVNGYRGLHIAAIEQTRSMVNNIRSKVAANKILPDPCLLVIDERFDGENALYNAWINPIYHTASIDKPVGIDADIWGVEAGFDVQSNQNHKLGIFASYRQGDYDLNGKGEKFISLKGSTIDIDSYIGGLYHRYDYRHLWTFLTLYGGIQQADMKTKDGLKADTDGVQFGGSFETGYIFNLSNDLKLEPSVGVFYTQIDFDDIHDSVGKTAKYSKIKQTELEAAIKLEKYFRLDNGIAKLYVKPGIIQVITSGDDVTITGLGKLDTYEDGTLGRVEVGGRYAITEQLSTYGFANYTWGSSYDAYSFGVGLNYSWQ